jgi:hypothetical protein
MTDFAVIVDIERERNLPMRHAEKEEDRKNSLMVDMCEPKERRPSAIQREQGSWSFRATIRRRPGPGHRDAAASCGNGGSMILQTCGLAMGHRSEHSLACEHHVQRSTNLPCNDDRIRKWPQIRSANKQQSSRISPIKRSVKANRCTFHIPSRSTHSSSDANKFAICLR